MIKPDIFKYTNVNKFILDTVHKNKFTAVQFQKLLSLKSPSYAWSIYKHGNISNIVALRIINKFKFNKKETTYFKLLVDIPKMKLLPFFEQNQLLYLIRKNYGIPKTANRKTK